MNSLRQHLASMAQELGFSALGIAPADSPQGDVLSRWIQSGAHADMRWLEQHLAARLNPQLVLEGAQSIIMLSYEYAREDARCAAGRVARYAQGMDYHKLLPPKLADIDEYLQLEGGVQRVFTDSGPISERHFAQAAGLGWIGRHGLMIRPKLGTYCVLASIITTLKLPYDSPHANYCGTCRRCIDACPTGALREGLPCDARKCLSYWTIEAKTPTPAHLAQAAPERIYGCDICQEVCPWNKKIAPLPIDPRLLMPHHLRHLQPETIAQMSQEEFQGHFRTSPIKRAGLTHLQANCAYL